MKSIYLIRDQVSGQYSPLFVEPNDRSAIRQFASFLDNSPVGAADYDLYLLGSLVDDDSSNVCPHIEVGICSEGTLKHIINGLGVNPITTKRLDNNDV